MTPFKALYGRDPPTLLKWTNEVSRVHEVEKLMEERNKILQELKEHLEQAQERMKTQADRKRREKEFEVGEAVYLKLKPYRLKSLAKKPNEKLAPRYYGPYKVIEKVSKVAYKLELPQTARIHNVFHASQLKQALQSSIPVQPLPTGLTEDLELQVTPEEVLQIRRNAGGHLQVLIKWKDLPEYENTWENPKMIQTQFPAFHLEDKVSLIGGGNDGSGRNGLDKLWGKVYYRRHKRGKDSKGSNVTGGM